MITIKDFNNRFPKLNDDYFNSLTEEEQKQYINRVEKYYNALLDIIIKNLELLQIEESLKNSENSFKPVSNDQKDLYQLMANDKLKYLYLRNNLYIERLSAEELKTLDGNNNSEIYSLVKDTYKTIIDDYLGQEMITNYGPELSKFYTKSSNLILGIRTDEYYPKDKNKMDLIAKREFELDFLKTYLETKIKEKFELEGTVIHYSKYSVKTSKNDESNSNIKTK